MTDYVESEFAPYESENQYAPSREPQVIIAGPFPPPLNGQSLATKQLAEMISSEFRVRKIDFGWLSGGPETSIVRFQSVRRSNIALAQALSTSPFSVLIYTGLSGSLQGYLRNLYTFSRIIPRNRIVLCHIHNGNIGDLWGRWFIRPTVNPILGRVTDFVVLNKLLTEKLAQVVPEDRIQVVPNTIDRSLLATDDELDQKRHRASTRSVLRVLFIGNMILSKGYMDLVGALRYLKRWGVQVRADFVGGWINRNDRLQFWEHVQSSGLVDIVSHHGSISDRERIKAILLRSDVFVLPTYYPYEAQPITIIEAQNAGLPVVATEHAGIPEMIQEGYNGFLVEPHAPLVLARRIAQLNDLETWRRMSEEARRSFVVNYHPDVVSKSWIDLVRHHMV